MEKALGRRRRGSSTSRDVIIVAARREFAARGFDGATLRAIARRADCDAALICYYFGAKEGLFAEAMTPSDTATFPQVPIEPHAGESTSELLRNRLREWRTGESQLIAFGLLRSVMGSPRAARLARELLNERWAPSVSAEPDARSAQDRDGLPDACLVALLLARDLVQLEPLASLDDDHLALLVGRMIQAQ